MITVWVATGAGAQQPITLQEVLAAADAGNGALASAMAGRDQAAGDVTAAQGSFDPLYRVELGTKASTQITFDHGIEYDEVIRSSWLRQSFAGDLGTGTSYAVNLDLGRAYVNSVDLSDSYASDLSASVTQQLLRGFRYRYNVENVTLAREGLHAAELTVEKERQAARFAAVSAYWTWVYDVESHQIAVDAVTVADEALRVGKLQVERGQLAPVEATRLEAALVQAQQDALDAENLAQQDANALLLTLGWDPAIDVLPATPAGDVPSIDIDPARAVEVALAQNLDLALARQDLETGQLQLDNAKHGLLPALAATATAGTSATRCRDPQCLTPGNALDATGALFAVEQPSASLGGVLAVPIGNRAARGARETAAAVVDQRQRALEDLERSVSAQVEDQVRTLSSAGQRVALADANQRLAEETLAGEEALMEAGRTIEKNVLEARTEVARSKVLASKARTDYQVAQAQLLELQGQLSATP